jgi:hypothetical protein
MALGHPGTTELLDEKETQGTMKKDSATIQNKIVHWLSTLSERTLTLTSIAILHSVFTPNVLAFLNHLTDRLPSLDSYLLVMIALFIMMLRAVHKIDKTAIFVHMCGFVMQLGLLALVLLK